MPARVQRIEDRSIIELIANPEKFDGREIQVVGYVQLLIEGTAVYLSETDARHGIMKNGLWLDVPPAGSPFGACHGKYSCVRGTFSAADHGHMAAFSGALHEITRLEPALRERGPGG
jgi:hypothetical protein